MPMLEYLSRGLRLAARISQVGRMPHAWKTFWQAVTSAISWYNHRYIGIYYMVAFIPIIDARIPIYPSRILISQVGSELLQRCCARRLEAPAAQLGSCLGSSDYLGPVGCLISDRSENQFLDGVRLLEAKWDGIPGAGCGKRLHKWASTQALSEWKLPVSLLVLPHFNVLYPVLSLPVLVYVWFDWLQPSRCPKNAWYEPNFRPRSLQHIEIPVFLKPSSQVDRIHQDTQCGYGFKIVQMINKWMVERPEKACLLWFRVPILIPIASRSKVSTCSWYI